MNKDLKKALLLIFAFVGFYLMFIAPDSAYMDTHQPLYYWSIITGAVMWIIGFVWLAKGFQKGEW